MNEDLIGVEREGKGVRKKRLKGGEGGLRAEGIGRERREGERK